MAYNVVNSQIKHNTRQLIFNKAKEVLKKDDWNSVITLPNTNFWLEEQILTEFPVTHIDSFEKERNVWEKAEVPYRINYNNSNVFEQTGGSYSFVWLDLCNALSKEVIDNLIKFIQNNKFRKEAIFAFTLCRKRGVKRNTFIYEKYYPDYLNKGIFHHIGNFLPFTKIETELLEYKCSDINNYSPTMGVYIFKLKNN